MSLTIGDLVALSTVRLGVDTRGARLFHDVVRPALTAPNGPAARNPVEMLAGLLGLEEPARGALIAQAHVRSIEALTTAPQRGLEPVSVLDPRYPALLQQIADPPIVLWMRGATLELNARPFVAIVGSRNATAEGTVLARRLARDLASHGFGIVSGMARGIDGAAHRGALDVAGSTVAILGCGADVTYPRSHRGLADEIATGGVVASEYLPGMPPLARHFPLRNRIISGLARATVVVEASERSGSLITARMALEQGRDVLAVPGSVASGCHGGCHALIKDGARLVETVQDIFEELGWNPPARSEPDAADKSPVSSWLQLLMPVGKACEPDGLSDRSGRPVADVLAELSRLELAGTVERRAGGRFVRLD
jgi:DNA processing protein